MCSRYQVPEGAEIAKYFHTKTKLPASAQFKSVIYPGYQTPAVLAPDGDDREIQSLFWGFVFRMPGKRDPSKMIEKILQNAVSETVDEKRTFKGAWSKSQRCILPAVNFMEPKDGQFVPIVDPKQPILAIAGIYGECTHKEKKHAACTMLTCEPNSFMEKFHDRMPVILQPDDIDEWLSPDTTPDQAKKLCRPFKGKLEFAT